MAIFTTTDKDEAFAVPGAEVLWVLEHYEVRTAPDLTPQGAVREVPASVSMRQARQVLLNLGLLDSVAGIIDALPPGQRERAAIDWEFSSVVDRNHPLLALLAGNMGLTTEQLDDLFVAASTL